MLALVCGVAMRLCSVPTIREDPLMSPLFCPICGKTTVVAVLDQVAINARVNNQVKEVGGLKAFQCGQQGHIFFVRTTDLESRIASAIDSTVEELKLESRSR